MNTIYKRILLFLLLTSSFFANFSLTLEAVEQRHCIMMKLKNRGALYIFVGKTENPTNDDILALFLDCVKRKRPLSRKMLENNSYVESFGKNHEVDLEAFNFYLKNGSSPKILNPIEKFDFATIPHGAPKTRSKTFTE